MNRATGCISIAVDPSAEVNLERVIEYVNPDPTARTCDIWADIFLENSSSEHQNALLLHRGSLKGDDITQQSWGKERNTSG